MSEQIQAVILSVGTELTEGDIQNTHFPYLGAELKVLGFKVVRSIQIPDNREIFLGELKRAVAESGLVLITGGLGPTSDDLTREVVAETAEVMLEFKEAIWESLKKRFRPSGRRISETNKKQALIPKDFQIIENFHGTAPAFAGWVRGTLVIALPGPPKELEPMFQGQIVPLLAKELHSGAAPELKATALMISESALEEAMQTHRQKEVFWGTRVAEDRILINFRGGSASAREQAYRGLEEGFGPVRIRRDDVKPNFLLFRALKEQGVKLALAESCTGGLLAKLITDIPGSSEVLWGSLVVYSNSAKEKLLGVDPGQIARFGAVSGEVVSAMSAGLLMRTGAGAGLAVTGIAGPDDGTESLPVGTVWISARRSSGEELQRKYNFTGSREQIRRRSSVAALLMAEALVLGRNWLA